MIKSSTPGLGHPDKFPLGHSLSALAACFWLATSHPVEAAAVSAAAPLAVDASHRLTVPVFIDRQGPFPFLVDTGANRTVISRALADRLGLPDGGPVTINGVSRAGRASSAIVTRLSVAGAETQRIRAPVLEESDIGAAGLLGIDTLQDRRVILDFEASTIVVDPLRPAEPIDPGEIVVRARPRFGQLVLVDAAIAATPIMVIIDTGSQNSLGNEALRRRLMRDDPGLEYRATGLRDVMGAHLPVESATIPAMRLGAVELTRVAVEFADALPFKLFRLGRTPAMLLGMDTLRAFRKVTIDFRTHKVRFLLAE